MWEHAQGTKKGESGENIATDIATTLGKIYYRMSHAGSTLYATDEKGEVLYHTEYDPWGNPQGKTKVNINFSPIENFNNFTGYTYDETLGIYYAQARFYNPEIKRFITEDPIKDGLNWYAYVGNNPVNSVDILGLAVEILYHSGKDKTGFHSDWYGHLDMSVGNKIYSFADYTQGASLEGPGIIMTLEKNTYIKSRTDEGRDVTVFTLDYTKEQEKSLKSVLEGYINGATYFTYIDPKNPDVITEAQKKLRH